MSSNSLLKNVKPSTDVEEQDKSFEDLEIERKQKKKKIYILAAKIVTAVLSIGLLSVLIYLIYSSITSFDNQKDKSEKLPEYEFLYLNDIHLDPKYVPDSLSPYCRTSSGSGVTFPYGQYGCDCPVSTFLSMIKYLPKAISNPKFILYGGDAPAHQLGYNIKEVRDLISGILSNISSVYPNVPILFCLGNNDYVPNYGNNDFSGDTDTFESIASVLSPFMSEGQKKTFESGGYYYHDFRELNLRMVLMNSVIYNTYRDLRNDPYSQFEWLRNISADARQNGYRIGVTFHIPPGVTYNTGSKLNQGWHEEYMREFDAIVKEFDIQFVITAHSHYDMITPLYMPNGVSGGFSLSAPAISTEHKNNPAFRVIKISDGQIVDYVQYFADILMNPDTLNWEIEYVFSQEYNMRNLSFPNLKKLADWVKYSSKGRWRYMEKICSLAADNGKFYYCVLTCTTEDEIKKCLGPLNSKTLLAKFFPYDGER